MEKKYREEGECLLLMNLKGKEPTMAEKGSGKEGNGLVGRGEEKLELRLGLPCQEHEEKSLLSLGFYTGSKNSTSATYSGAKRGFPVTVESSFVLNSSGGGVETHKANGKSCFPPPPPQVVNAPPPTATKATGCNNTSEEDRTASVAVVGWPPIRSFRRNLASTSKASTELYVAKSQALQAEKTHKGLFVKITMDGIPIGRKMDLKSLDTYEKLSLAVDELFRGLLAAQKDPPTNGPQKNMEELEPISGVLDGSGEYTLVYEDDEGDWMLVGDVPWDMFVSSAKRLRVLKSSELSRVSLGEVIRKRAQTK